jgi:hypothetical protein
MLRTLGARFLLTFIPTILAIDGLCPAQVTKVNTGDLMDTVMDMKKAAATADKFSPDGSKYCHWGVATLDASDLDSAVSRFLLSRGSQVVPDDISASKMWHVGLVADDLINQFEFRLQECNLGMRLNPDIHSVAVIGKPVLSKLQDAERRFAEQAFQQTEWQEWKYIKPLFPNRSYGASDGLGAPGAEASEILTASLAVREAWEAASRVVIEAETTKECVRFGPLHKDEPVELNKLIDRLSSVPRSGSYILSSDIWLVTITTESPELAVQYALEACGPFALWKKKAKKVADAAVDSDHRLKAAVAKFNALALKQTEWEEQVFQKEGTIQ